MTYCTSVNCPYVKTCARKDKSEPESREDTFYNFEIHNGCDINSSYSDFIKGVDND
jgi:hypothetical protein